MLIYQIGVILILQAFVEEVNSGRFKDYPSIKISKILRLLNEEKINNTGETKIDSSITINKDILQSDKQQTTESKVSSLQESSQPSVKESISSTPSSSSPPPPPALEADAPMLPPPALEADASMLPPPVLEEAMLQCYLLHPHLEKNPNHQRQHRLHRLLHQL